jgi:hypothetical protein
MSIGTQALDFAISESGPLSQAARARGYCGFAEIAEAVRALPYGRVEHPEDIAAVLGEHRGTCSSKHRFLAALAHECGHTEIELMVGLYEMSEGNTPGIGAALRMAQLSAIPEAHCYLMCRGRRFDFTGLAAAPFESLIEERVVSPADLPSTKLAYHRCAIDIWARARGLDADYVWAVREQCIALLANSTLQARAGTVLHQPPPARAGERER